MNSNRRIEQSPAGRVVFVMFLFSCLFLLLGTALAEESIRHPGNQWENQIDWPWCELGGSYSLMHKKYCDRYFSCENGQAFLGQCEDGFGFIPYEGCKLLNLVDCSKRPKLQPPKGSGECPRLYGLYATPSRGCGTFVKCDNGTAAADGCAPGLVFDDRTKLCRSPTEAETQSCFRPIQSKPNAPAAVPSCPTEVQGFTCPRDNLYPYGDHSRHPYPGNCHLFIMCLRDGTLKVGGCDNGSLYSPVTQNCELPNKVPGCSAKSYRMTAEDDS